MYEWGSAYDLKFMYVWGWKFLFPFLIRLNCLDIHAYVHICIHTYIHTCMLQCIPLNSLAPCMVVPSIGGYIPWWSV